MRKINAYVFDFCAGICCFCVKGIKKVTENDIIMIYLSHLLTKE